MKQGIIMDINERFLTMLTPEGEFLRARKQDLQYEIGQEINFFPIEISERKKSSFLSIFESFKGKSVAAAAMALILAVVTLNPFSQSNEVYAYMSIDINPSIEIGVNEKLQVIELIPYNEDGKRIIHLIDDWKKEDMYAVADEIFDEIEKQGYIKENKDITIATVYTGDREKKADKKLSQEINQIKQTREKDDVEINVLKGTEKDREKAKKQGITTGTYKKQNAEKKSKQINPIESDTTSKPKKVDKKAAVVTPKPKTKVEKNSKAAKNQQVDKAHPKKLEHKPTKKTLPGQVKKNQKADKHSVHNTGAGKKATPPGQEKKQKQTDSKNNEKKNKKVKKHPVSNKNEHKKHQNKQKNKHKNKHKHQKKSGR